MLTRLSLKQLAARMGYDDENYLVWLKAWLTEPRPLKAWTDYLEGCKTDRNSVADKNKLVSLVTTILESEEGTLQRGLTDHSELSQAEIEVQFVLHFVRGCQTRYWLWKGWTNKEKMASIAVDVLSCLEYEFSDVEIVTSLLAKAMIRAAAEQGLHLHGFLVKQSSPNLTVNSISSTEIFDGSPNTSASTHRLKESLVDDVGKCVIEQEQGGGAGEDTDSETTVFVVGEGDSYNWKTVELPGA